jgi:hypothetical protein
VYTDNDQTDLGTEAQLDPVEEGQDEVLRWLLDMDLAEPEEMLFGLSEEEYQDQGLTDYEVEVAARPLVRGNASSDDLDSYVAEEIVISSDSSDRSDIYAAQEAAPQVEESDEESPAETMAIDHSRRAQPEQVNDVPEADGSDILALTDKPTMTTWVRNSSPSSGSSDRSLRRLLTSR